jgi:hypothetical protein
VLTAAARDGDIPLAFVIADNGLSERAARDLGAMLGATNRPHQIVPAVTERSHRYAAAHARNAALNQLSDLPPDSPLRRQHLLFLDDDTVMSPYALRRLLAALTARDGAVAACPKVVPTADPEAWLNGDRRNAAAGATPRLLPDPVAGGAYDLLSVTSHGSLVTGRTVGLLIRQDPVLHWIREHGPLFYEDTPYGSTEDILAMAVLSRIGQVWTVPAARVADEARRTPGATRAQQFAWGYDHAWLVRALAGAGLLTPGMRALSWQPGGWECGHLPSPATGFLVNPAEVRFGFRMLSAIAESTVLDDMFGADAPHVRAGTAQLGRVLQRWDAGQATAHRTARPDLPALARRDWSALRDGVDALVGHLAGNVVGSLESCSPTTPVPPYFLYGARQPADL